jgi:hypothetical protein
MATTNFNLAHIEDHDSNQLIATEEVAREVVQSSATIRRESAPRGLSAKTLAQHPAIDSVHQRLQPQVGQSLTALCLWFGHYNFCRIHNTIRATSAMQAYRGSVRDLSELLAVQ